MKAGWYRDDREDDEEDDDGDDDDDDDESFKSPSNFLSPSTAFTRRVPACSPRSAVVLVVSHE